MASVEAWLAHIALLCPPRPASSRWSIMASKGVASSVQSTQADGLLVAGKEMPGGFVQWSRDARKVDPLGRQLADAGNARYVRDQLVPDGQARVGGFDCRARGRHQNRVVLFSRARLGGGRLGPALITALAGSNPTRP